ncbi:hypothetical protein RRG08_034232 [Elysia crispata]|uniref:Uncharacterized protein n=1 Tax=Elysia crispata TaxID=231223 RepID=A0AAE1A1L4_9GAST|nr:hypothetical protein RRG08_034232 [Elysia crispata]
MWIRPAEQLFPSRPREAEEEETARTSRQFTIKQQGQDCIDLGLVSELSSDKLCWCQPYTSFHISSSVAPLVHTLQVCEANRIIRASCRPAPHLGPDMIAASAELQSTN